MTTIVYAKHEPYLDGHLGKVGAEMDLAGSPTLPAVRYGDALIALAGSHRLALAHHKGLVPKLIIFESEVDGAEGFWDQALKGMPRYEFDEVLALDMTDSKLFKGLDPTAENVRKVAAELRAFGLSAVRRRAADLLEAVVEDRDDLQKLFDLQWDADARARKRWQEAHPDRPGIRPDRADMVVWLMEQHAQLTFSRDEWRDLVEKERELREARAGVLKAASALAQYASAHGSDWAASPPEIVDLIGRVVLEVAQLRLAKP